MNKYTLGTILGSALLSLMKSKKGSHSFLTGDFLEEYVSSPHDKYFEVNYTVRLSLPTGQTNHVGWEVFCGFEEDIQDLVSAIESYYLDNEVEELIEQASESGEDFISIISNHFGTHEDDIDYVSNGYADAFFGAGDFGTTIKISPISPENIDLEKNLDWDDIYELEKELVTELDQYFDGWEVEQELFERYETVTIQCKLLFKKDIQNYASISSEIQKGLSRGENSVGMLDYFVHSIFEYAMRVKNRELNNSNWVNKNDGSVLEVSFSNLSDFLAQKDEMKVRIK